VAYFFHVMQMRKLSHCKRKEKHRGIRLQVSILFRFEHDFDLNMTHNAL